MIIDDILALRKRIPELMVAIRVKSDALNPAQIIDALTHAGIPVIGGHENVLGLYVNVKADHAEQANAILRLHGVTVDYLPMPRTAETEALWR